MKRFALVCLLLCSLFLTCAHGDPTVTIEPGASGVPDAVVDQIVADYPDAGAITIISHHTAIETAIETAESISVLPAATILIVLGGWLGFLYIRRKVHTA